MKTITIRQPWAWLIVHGHKDIENRRWATTYRGPILIHAASRIADVESYEHALVLCERLGIELPKYVDVGAVVGVVTITDCVRSHPSPWFSGPFGFVLSNARLVEPVPLRGKLGLYEVNLVPRYKS